MALAKLASIKQRLEISGTAQDAELAAALSAASAMVEQYCNRTIEYVSAGFTEYYSGGLSTIHLRAFPVVTLTSVKVALDYDFSGADALVADEEFRLHAARGRLLRLPDGMAWECGSDAVQVIYKGGYCSPEEVTPPGGTSYPPTNIQEAVLIQAVELYKRRRDPGYKSADGAAGNITFGYAPDVEVVKAAQALLIGERRILA